MKNRIKRSVPNASMAVALLALFVALTGSAYAGVKLSKNSVTNKTIKNGAVTGNKIKKRTVTAANLKNDTLTGAQINESTLTGVSAATLSGKGADAFVSSADRIHFNVTSNKGDAPKTLAKFGPWTLTGRCENNGPDGTAYIDVTSSADDTYIYTDSDLDAGETSHWINYGSFSPNERSFTSYSPAFLDPATGLSSLDGDGETAGIWVGFPGADCRFVGNWFVDTP